MADPTREQAIEACFKYAKQRGYSPLFDTHAIGLLLTRDGRLRERLATLLAETITRAEQAEADGLSDLAAAIERCADELEAALKEGREVNAKEALSQFCHYEEDIAKITDLWSGEGLVKAAIEALREKVEREEKERPKVTLKEQVKACYYASGLACGPNVQFLEAAGDTLRRLEEEGGRIFDDHAVTSIAFNTHAGIGSSIDSKLVALLRSLGVEARKP